VADLTAGAASGRVGGTGAETLGLEVGTASFSLAGDNVKDESILSEAAYLSLEA
jgi:hypothetical protein